MHSVWNELKSPGEQLEAKWTDNSEWGEVRNRSDEGLDYMDFKYSAINQIYGGSIVLSF